MKQWVKVGLLFGALCWLVITDQLQASTDWEAQLVALQKRIAFAPSDTLKSRLFGEMSQLCAHHLASTQ